MPPNPDVQSQETPCEFCIDAGADFDYCRVCGRGEPTPPAVQPQASPLLEAVRKARGDYTGAEVEHMILATHPPDCACGKHVSTPESVEVELKHEAWGIDPEGDNRPIVVSTTPEQDFFIVRIFRKSDAH